MEISVEEARKVVEAHYSEKGLEFSPTRSDAEVLRVYHNLQEEIQISKRYRWEKFTDCGLTLNRAIPIEDEPVGSQ